MKAKSLFIVCLYLLCNITVAQGIRFIDVVHQPSQEFQAQVRADKNGGSITFNRTYASGCNGTYNIQWSFSKDISTLQDGEEFTIYLKCINCQTPCGYKKTYANVASSSNVTSIPKYPSYAYNGNLELVSTTAGPFGVHGWYAGHTSHSYTFRYTKKKNVKHTAFVFLFAGHRVYYVFEEGTAVSNTINCHSLLGLGKLVNGLELGAYQGYGWDWMDKTAGYALEHIKASNCLSSSYLTDLKSRLYFASDTRIFYNEIQSYSRRLEDEVATSCSCCSN